MATQNFPSFSFLQATFLQEFEGKIGQDSPLNNKAFLRICSYVWAIIAMLLQREVGQNTKENFAISASRDQLINVFGVEYELPIKAATGAVLNIDLPTTSDPTTIPALTNFTGTDNGILYYDASSRTSAAGSVVLQVTARTTGVIGNLAVGRGLEMAVNIAGATKIATITSVESLGADAEETEVYRQRVLDIIRAPGGGGNSADYRNWAQMQEGVKRAYPYSGLPWDDPLTPGQPPQRTVYIESDTSIDPDGIPPQSLLDDTEETIITDPDTEQHREPLTLTSYELYVEPIRRTDIYTRIITATFETGTEAQVKAEIDTAVTAYYLSLTPFIQGLDTRASKNDIITKLTISEQVQSVLTANGASAQDIIFGEAPGEDLNEYSLGQGELAKNAGVSYA